MYLRHLCPCALKEVFCLKLPGKKIPQTKQVNDHLQIKDPPVLIFCN